MNYIPLTKVCDFQGGSQPPKEQWIDHAEEGYIRMLQIRDFTQPDKDNIEYVRITKTVKTCNEDDILIGRYGASVGKILTGLSGAYNVAIIKTIPDASKLTKRFLYHYLNSPYFQSFILSVGSRAAQAGFNKEDLSDAQIPQLSLKEQEYVTSRLDKIVDLIALRKQQLSKLDELVKSRFVELFTPFFSQQKILLGDLCETITKGTTPTTLGFDFVDNGVNFIKIENISANEKIGTTKMLHISEECNIKLKRSILKENDILFSIAGTKMGITAKVTSDVLPANTNQALAIIRLKKEVSMNVDFLIELLHADMIIEQIESMKSTVAQTNLSLDNVRNFNVIVPPIELQNQFSTFVEQTDKSKLAIQKSLEKLEILKKSLMQKYFG